MTTTQPAAQPGAPARTGRDDRAATPVVAFLGTGRMGGPMAANLARRHPDAGPHLISAEAPPHRADRRGCRFLPGGSRPP